MCGLSGHRSKTDGSKSSMNTIRVGLSSNFSYIYIKYMIKDFLLFPHLVGAFLSSFYVFFKWIRYKLNKWILDNMLCVLAICVHTKSIDTTVKFLSLLTTFASAITFACQLYRSSVSSIERQKQRSEHKNIWWSHEIQEIIKHEYGTMLIPE